MKKRIFPDNSEDEEIETQDYFEDYLEEKNDEEELSPNIF